MAKLTTAIRGAQIADAFAGDGLEWSGDDILIVALKDYAGIGIDSGELFIDFPLMSGLTIDEANDKLMIGDFDDNNMPKKASIADLMTAVAGTGLTATAGVLTVDDISDAVLEADILYENESDNCSGSQTEFTLAQTPISNSVQVYLNGLIQEEGSGKDYTIAGTTITFAIAPASGDICLIHYIQDN